MTFQATEHYAHIHLFKIFQFKRKTKKADRRTQGSIQQIELKDKDKVFMAFQT